MPKPTEEVYCVIPTFGKVQTYMPVWWWCRSIIRSTLAIEFKGKSREEHYALGDLFIDGDLSETDFHIFSEYGFLGLFPMGNRRFRMIASNPLSQNSKDPGPELEELQKIYDMRSHISAKLHGLGWSSWFRINSRMVNQLQANGPHS